MPKIKGTDITVLRKLIQKQGDNYEKCFLELLEPQLLNLYKNTLSTTWVTEELHTQLYEVAADFLLPEHPEKMVELAKTVAKDSYQGIYRFFLRIPTVPFLVKKAANIWYTYHDTGKAGASKIEKKKVQFFVKDFPDLPRGMRLLTNGHILALLELAGFKQVSVTNDDSDPTNWKWYISWE
jgi:hypothetical protein